MLYVSAQVHQGGQKDIFCFVCNTNARDTKGKVGQKEMKEERKKRDIGSLQWRKAEMSHLFNIKYILQFETNAFCNLRQMHFAI